MSSDMSKQEKKALKHQDKALKQEDKAARKQEKKMRKQAKKENKHLHGSHHAAPVVGTGLGSSTSAALPRDVTAPVVHTGAVPVVGVPVVAAPVVAAPVVPMQNMSLGDKVVHEAERVIRHEPLVEKEIINERPVEVKREHHIQPVIHETEHRIQPIIKTEATTETSYIVQDKNVMLPPIVEPTQMVAGNFGPVLSTAPATNTLPATSAFPTVSRSALEGHHHEHGHTHAHGHEHGVHHHHEHGDKHLYKQHDMHGHEHGVRHLEHGDKHMYKQQDKQLRKQEKLLRKQHMHNQHMMMGGFYPGGHGYGYDHRHQHMMMQRGLGGGFYNQPMMMHQHQYQRGLGYGHQGWESDRLLDAEQRLNWGMVAPLAPTERVIPIEGVSSTSGGGLSGLKDKLHLGGHSHSHAHDAPRSQLVEPSAPGMSGVETGSMQNKAGFGQKIKGAIKEVQGTITRNPAMKEEGKMLMQGVDPVTAHSATGAATGAPTTATTAI